MRVIVFFDLPSLTSEEKREYRRFRKFLTSEGFIMMQESVYTKLALNKSVVDSIVKKTTINRPKKGLVEVLVITEKQFANIKYITGHKQTLYEDSEERLLII